MSDSAVIYSVDPRTGIQSVSAARPSSADEVAAAVAAATGAAQPLTAIGREGRARLLDAVAQELRADAEQLVLICRRETGLAETRLNAELERTAAQLEFLGDVVREGSYLNLTIDHETTGATARPDLRLMNVALGPVAVFAASNFPFAFSVAGGDTASALAVGCPVVVKAHSSHPDTSMRTAAAVERAIRSVGLPQGTVGLVFGRTAGIDLVRHPDIRAVGFTGSVAGGRALAEHAARRPDPIPFYGELGSVNPFVVTPAAASARGAEIARDVVASFTLGAGQFCTKPGLVFVPAGSGGDALVEGARRETEESIAGYSLNAGFFQDFRRVTDDLQNDPAARLTVGRAAGDDGFAVRSLLLEIDAESFGSEHAEEHFGPLAVIVRYSDIAQLEGILRGLAGALVGTVHGESQDEVARRVLPLLAERSGRVVWNGVPTGVAVTWASNHGGPWPSAYDARHSSVGAASIGRWVRPIAWQNAPHDVLPPELRDDDDSAPRRVDGVLRLHIAG